jgi:hypothetical protein
MVRGLIAILVAALLFLMNAGTGSARSEPLSWRPASVQSVYAWRINKHDVLFAAALELPNACYRAKVKREPASPREPLTYEVLWGQIPGAMCAQMLVLCAVTDVPRLTARNYVVVNLHQRTQKLAIQTRPPHLPKSCPS